MSTEEKKEIPVPPFITWHCNQSCRSNGPFIIDNPNELIIDNKGNAKYKCGRCGYIVEIARPFWHYLPACQLN